MTFNINQLKLPMSRAERMKMITISYETNSSIFNKIEDLIKRVNLPRISHAVREFILYGEVFVLKSRSLGFTSLAQIGIFDPKTVRVKIMPGGYITYKVTNNFINEFVDINHIANFASKHDVYGTSFFDPLTLIQQKSDEEIVEITRAKLATLIKPKHFDFSFEENKELGNVQYKNCASVNWSD